MNVTYSESVRQWGEGLTLAQQGTKRLEEVLGPSAGLATAEWDRAEDDKGRALFTLRLRDFTGEVTRRFPPDELRSSSLTSFHMYRLWGDLQQIHLQKQLDDLMRRGTNGEN